MMMITMEVTGELVIDMHARDWCLIPYLGHKNGCPNYGQKKTCPPFAPMIESFVDLSDVWFVIVQSKLFSFQQ